MAELICRWRFVVRSDLARGDLRGRRGGVVGLRFGVDCPSLCANIALSVSLTYSTFSWFSPVHFSPPPMLSSSLHPSPSLHFHSFTSFSFSLFVFLLYGNILNPPSRSSLSASFPPAHHSPYVCLVYSFLTSPYPSPSLTLLSSRP